MTQESAFIKTDEKDLLEMARNLIAKENWREAISLLDPSRRSGSLSTDGQQRLAYCYSREKNYEEAIKIFEGLSRQFPNEAKWFYYLGYQYRNNKNDKSAIEAYKKCLELFPKAIKVLFELGKIYEDRKLSLDAFKEYCKGIEIYKAMNPDDKKKYGIPYSGICARAANLISSNIENKGGYEIEALLKESTNADPDNADTWYRLGCFFIDAGKYDAAIEQLKKAKSLSSKKEYIPHKLGQAYLQKGDADQALKIYETIPQHKRSAYILHGLGQCHIKKGNYQEGARYLYAAFKREPEKWYHQRDLGMVLAEMGDRDQAINMLTKANAAYKKENGKDFLKIIAKIDGLKKMTQGETVILEKKDTAITTISYGEVIRYNSQKGYGFIKDNNDGVDVFFHISKVKNKQIEPKTGLKVKFSREKGEKGPQASIVWEIS